MVGSNIPKNVQTSIDRLSRYSKQAARIGKLMQRIYDKKGDWITESQKLKIQAFLHNKVDPLIRKMEDEFQVIHNFVVSKADENNSNRSQIFDLLEPMEQFRTSIDEFHRLIMEEYLELERNQDTAQIRRQEEDTVLSLEEVSNRGATRLPVLPNIKNYRLSVMGRFARATMVFVLLLTAACGEVGKGDPSTPGNNVKQEQTQQPRVKILSICMIKNKQQRNNRQLKIQYADKKVWEDAPSEIEGTYFRITHKHGKASFCQTKNGGFWIYNDNIYTIDRTSQKEATVLVSEIFLKKYPHKGNHGKKLTKATKFQPNGEVKIGNDIWYMVVVDKKNWFVEGVVDGEKITGDPPEPPPLPSSPNFRIAVDIAIQLEGGVSNHKDDSGGLTNIGVTQVKYDEYRDKYCLVKRPVTQITEKEMYDIYATFWKSSKCEQLIYPQLQVAHFCAAINNPEAANKFVQRALNALNSRVKVDSKLGPITLGKVALLVQAGKGPKLLEQYFVFQEKRYRWLAAKRGKGAFLRGWLNRITRTKRMINQYIH